MGRYRDVWVTVVVAVGMLGAWAALVELTVVTGAVILLVVSLLSLCVLMPLHHETEPGYRRPHVVIQSGAVGLGILALCGLFVLLGPVALLLLLLGAVTSPRALRYAGRVWQRGSATGTVQGTTSPPPGVIAEPSPLVLRPLTPAALDLQALCWAWRCSYVQLERCRTVCDRQRVVAERQHLLDELERRNPQGLGAWLGSGARAAGNPTRYVLPARPVRSTIARRDLSSATDEAYGEAQGRD